jgi:protein-S-isoprenylcysteine O-methyltransferase Ste14
MTNEQKQKLKEWQGNFQIFLRGHYDAANRCERLNLWFGIPVVVLSTLVGTSIFSALGLESAPPWAKILVGCVSLLVAILAALQTFLRYSERGEKHRIAGASFAALHKRN